MPPANPYPLDPSPSGPFDATLSNADPAHQEGTAPDIVSQDELNAWRRGFTPQAEIWNGRLAMLGLSVGLGILVVARVYGSLHS
jgi:hypothetical protein